MTVTLWFTLSLITGSNLDPSCAILPLSWTSEEHNSLCWAISEWPDSSHRETRTRGPRQKNLLKFPLLQFNISCASNRFFFRVQVVKNSLKPSTSGGRRTCSSHWFVTTSSSQKRWLSGSKDWLYCIELEVQSSTVLQWYQSKHLTASMPTTPKRDAGVRRQVYRLHKWQWLHK